MHQQTYQFHQLIDSYYAKRYVLRNQDKKVFSIVRLLMQNHALEEYVEKSVLRQDILMPGIFLGLKFQACEIFGSAL